MFPAHRWISALLLAIPIAARAADPVDFDRDVAPILAARCLDCHNASDRKGDLDLSSASTALRRNDPVIEPGNLVESLLWTQVRDDEMPKKKPLKEPEKAILRAWIESGARWGKTDPIDRLAYTTETRAGADWWSLKAVQRPEVPKPQDRRWVRNPIDGFVLASLESKGLSPSPPADRRTLIRRVSFDLIGLPPTPEEIDAFLADDDPMAFEKVVDRLLASPHYGERWARHWLDLARYSESQGFEYDKFRPNAWHYRDYVIDAFNSDKPYDVFLQEQIAGDVQGFEAGRGEVSKPGIIATSLLVCGAWDQAGNAQANLIQRTITREEELEDLVGVVGQTFLGMTINCARCHSHKFDPITHDDYYRFKSAFEGVRHGERSIETPAEAIVRIDRIAGLKRAIDESDREIAAIESDARKTASPRNPGFGSSEIARWTFDSDPKDSIGDLDGELVGGARVRNGRLVLGGEGDFLRTPALKRDLREKTLEAWLILANLDQGGGGVLTVEAEQGGTFDAIVFGERQPRRWTAGSNFYRRTKEQATPPETAINGAPIQLAITYAGDDSITVYRNGKRLGDSYRQGSLQTFKAGESRILIGLRHSGGASGFLKAEIDSARIYDRALSDSEIAASFDAGPESPPIVSDEQMLASLTPSQREKRAIASDRLIDLRKQLAAIPAPAVSYVGVRQQPAPSHRLVRGDVSSPAEIVSPGGIAIIKIPSADFGLKPDAPEASRRVELARWMADPRHPLTARVMVNRLWHYHFGRGIVETTNDFGFNGSRPTHPGLLDWLASELTEGTAGQDRWSLKRMHRLIVLSATYRQSSTFNDRAAAIDAENTLLWRFAPRRLEGEIVRDAMLAVSGQLNRQVGGPSFQPFNVTSRGSDFYNLIDPVAPEFNRRSIYRAHVSSGKSPLMDALDCPDPSIKTPTRRVTTTPLAALALMNNSFVLRQADRLADRSLVGSGSDSAAAIRLAYRLAFGRTPTAPEQDEALAFVRDQGMPAFCWVLLNASEFLYVN